MDVKYTYDKEARKEAAATTDTVVYEYSLVNNGLLSLYNISMHDSVLKEHKTVITCTDVDGNDVTGSTPGEVSELASIAKNGLVPTAKLVCRGEDSVTQDEVCTSWALAPNLEKCICCCPLWSILAELSLLEG